MPPQLKFNSYGVPYLVEFSDVAFRAGSRSDLRSASPSLRPYPSSTTLTAASTETLANPEGDGLYIQFASHKPHQPHKLSDGRLLRLKHRIAKAVVAAGMDSSPAADVYNSIDQIPSGRLSRSTIQSLDVAYGDHSGALFRGTYGQVMSALTAVGLTTTPCTETGVKSATRLGALFVAKPTEQGIVELRKLTLWA
ncbi:hypothetical protein BKA93DRAFT_725633 [Sparassis latifolia]